VRIRTGAAVVWLSALAVGLIPASAMAQTAPAANTGAVKLTAGLDVPSVYYFRGIRQETDPKVTLWPYGDVGITLAKRVSVNFGVWNSLHTGSSGSKVSGKGMHYEEDFYSTLTLGLPGAAVSTKYIAYTSPNQSYNTVKEVDFQLTGTQKYAPYGLVAFELNQTKGARIIGADSGQKKGTYLELGAGPNWPIGKATFAIPVSIGLSLKNYYEANGKDNKFGFFDVGGMITLPLLGVPARFGSWNIHGRVDYLRLGDGTMAIGLGTGTKKNKAVMMGGIGLSY
jgi:hypothetical protein